MRTKAIALYRVGYARWEHQDTLPRQQKSARALARAKGLRIVAEHLGFHSGVENSLVELLMRSVRSKAQIVIVENAATLAKNEAMREGAIIALAACGVRVMTATGEDLLARAA